MTSEPNETPDPEIEQVADTAAEAGESRPTADPRDAAARIDDSPGETVENHAPDTDAPDIEAVAETEELATEELATEELATGEAFPDLSAARKSRAQLRADRKAAKAAAKAESLASDDSAGRHRHWLASLALASGAAALTAAIVCLGYFGYTGITAYVGSAGKAAQLRDESIDAAEQAIINITNIDVDDFDAWEKRLESSLTGEALKQTQDGDTVKALKKQIAEGRRTQTLRLVSEIRRAACTEVNVEENRATVLVFSTSTAQGSTGEDGTEQPGESVPFEFLVNVVESDGMRKVDNIVPLTEMRLIDEGTTGQKPADKSGSNRGSTNGSDSGSGTGNEGGR
ncbi:hypothetical protein GOHSU_08_00770 [Gordonia hirsuta DSM 44140 = NBRC 16056]|uniref:Mce-associated membrane protein n=1 Tax=Gordonia hirsuta DSM 44140 = NBRC 16056 TaxID=1121927 RepID=L7L6K6_9ACTN|nr:hypothetical protein [Gordonia hirsuta]GAC56549.1 hypothetical protein GOHSU_08_00770 [Gordonia hirsuta DSM 44140 = NBRC 16056]